MDGLTDRPTVKPPKRLEDTSKKQRYHKKFDWLENCQNCHSYYAETDKMIQGIRLDIRQSCQGRLGSSSNAKTARNFHNVLDGPTDRPTRQGVESRVHD